MKKEVLSHLTRWLVGLFGFILSYVAFVYVGKYSLPFTQSVNFGIVVGFNCVVWAFMFGFAAMLCGRGGFKVGFFGGAFIYSFGLIIYKIRQPYFIIMILVSIISGIIFGVLAYKWRKHRENARMNQAEDDGNEDV